MIDPGKRDRRITIQRATTIRDALNHPVETWSEVATRWAEKRDVSDRERVASAEVSAAITTRFRILWSLQVASVNPKDRIVCDGKTYAIEAVKEIGRREELEISAVARADL